jgi:hypothetical protein
VQAVQLDLALLSFAENSPAPHDLHDTFPPSFWYLPLLQFEHALAPAAETVPAPQSPHGSDSAPTDMEYLPAKQSVQAPPPVSTLYFPVTQDVHEAPDEPALQTQLAEVPLFAGDLEFPGHPVHDTNV